MSAIALLCELIAQRGKASVAAYRQSPHLETLLRGGFVCKDGVISSIACVECDIPHDAHICFEVGTYGYYCPDLGFVPLARAMIEAVTPDFAVITSSLADAFDCKRRKSTPIHGTTWRIGSVASEGGDVMMYFSPSLQDERDAADLAAALTREVRSPYRLILTASGSLPTPDAKTGWLADVVELLGDQTGFAAVADPRDIVEAPRKRLGGAPNRHKQAIVSLIQARMQNGNALPGRNEEAKALSEVLRQQDHIAQPPSLTTIRRYLSEARGGS